jgi:signal transduction histidine kinase
VNRAKQPKIRYRTSIWLFSFLILVMFAVFSLGIALNISKWGQEWKQVELNYFITSSHSVEHLFGNSPARQSILSGFWDEAAEHEIEKLMQPFFLNTLDRVYLVFDEHGIQIFPVIEPIDELAEFAASNEFWQRGRDGIRSFTVEYESWDGTPVIARIIPESSSEAETTVLLVVERNRKVFSRTDFRVAVFFLLSILGLVFAYIVVLYYGRKMLQPFVRLETILSDVVSMKSHVIQAQDDFQDPVQRSIETFAEVIRKLQEQEYRLEFLGNRLEQPMSPMDTYEDELLDKVNTGIITFDQNRVIQTMTSRVPKLFQLKSSDVKGHKCEDVFGHSSEICRVLDMGLNNKKAVRQQNWKWQVSSSIPIWLSISTTLIQETDGSVIGVGCVVRDVTLVKKLRSQIREKEHLAALGELSAGIAHEFRNPLGAIQGNAQYLKEEVEEEHLAVIAGEISSEVNNLERIIRDFLHFARPVQPDVSPQNPYLLIQDEINSVKRLYGENIEFNLNAGANVVSVELDENLFRQAVHNILENACQAMNGSGSIEVKIAVADTGANDAESSGVCTIQFQDTGPGIPPDLIEEVFKPFYTGRQDGIGLGLAIVKKIILMHNGFVEIESREESGAIIRISIPVEYDRDHN